MTTSLFRQVVRQYKLSTKLSPMFTVSPELADVCTRLVDFIGTTYQVRDEPLVKEMLCDAIGAYRAARSDGQQNVAFVNGLFSRSHELYLKRYAAFRGTRYDLWYPFYESIPEFERRQAHGSEFRIVDEAVPVTVTQRSAAFQLAARVLNGQTFHLYFEHYEAGVAYAHD
jgi:hypothetical protein